MPTVSKTSELAVQYCNGAEGSRYDGRSVTASCSDCLTRAVRGGQLNSARGSDASLLTVKREGMEERGEKEGGDKAQQGGRGLTSAGGNTECEHR